MPTKAQAVITVQQFARDMWAALREDLRSQLGDAITDEVFDQQIPPWENLPKEARDEKVRIARYETLWLINKAGYEVRRKKAQPTQ